MAGKPASSGRVGILALQGCVDPHVPHLEKAGLKVTLVRKAAQLKEIDGLLLPGGESTTMLKLLDVLGMEDALKNAFTQMPCWGICAGAILMAKAVSYPEQKSFGILDINIERNAYGRQLESFNTEIEGAEVSFIRAPKISYVSTQAQILATYEGDPVWVREGAHMVTTFHPELSRESPSPFHKYFAQAVLRRS